MIFERRNHPLISLKAFIQRMMFWIVVTVFAFIVSLGIGIVGYHYFEQMAWIDALLNASMILGGMGPVDPLYTDEGKIFASFYAIYSGVFLIFCGGILLAPIFHRVLHHFHADEHTDKEPK